MFPLLFCLVTHGLFLLSEITTHMCNLQACGRLNHSSQLFMPSLYQNSTSSAFVLWLWSTSHYSGVFFPNPLMLGLGMWLALTRGIWAKVTLSHFKAEPSRDIAYFLLHFLHPCDLSGAELSWSIFFSLHPVTNPCGADLNPTQAWNRTTPANTQTMRKINVVVCQWVWGGLLHSVISAVADWYRAVHFSRPSFPYL